MSIISRTIEIINDNIIVLYYVSIVECIPKAVVWYGIGNIEYAKE